MTDHQRSTIIVMAPNWLGDAVMALPAIADVRRHFADARLVVAARPSVAALFRVVRGVDAVVAPDQAEGDVGILFPNSFRSAWTLKQTGVKERWGYRSDFRGLLLTKAVSRPRRKVHFGEYYQNLVRRLGVDTGPLRQHLEVPKAKMDAAAALLRERGWQPGRPLVGLAPGAAFGHAKRWPTPRYAALARSLRDEAGAACVVLGRSEDREAAEGIEGIDLIGRTDLLTLMGVLAHCDVVVASDSGALHLAAAIGTPVVAIYGPTDERYSLPIASARLREEQVRAVFEPVFCRPCFLRECPIDHRCMKRIAPERVLALVREQLLIEQESVQQSRSTEADDH